MGAIFDVRAEFHRLAQDLPQFDTPTRAFLGRGYNLKTIAPDYGTDPNMTISREEALEAVATA